MAERHGGRLWGEESSHIIVPRQQRERGGWGEKHSLGDHPPSEPRLQPPSNSKSATAAPNPITFQKPPLNTGDFQKTLYI